MDVYVCGARWARRSIDGFCAARSEKYVGLRRPEPMSSTSHCLLPTYVHVCTSYLHMYCTYIVWVCVPPPSTSCQWYWTHAAEILDHGGWKGQVRMDEDCFGVFRLSRKSLCPPRAPLRGPRGRLPRPDDTVFSVTAVSFAEHHAPI